MVILTGVKEGLRKVARSWGLVPVLFVVNLGLAALLAVPLAMDLERDLRHREAAENMMYGFDFGWWRHWSDARQGFQATFGPEILGLGFVFKNMDLLLRDGLHARLLGGKGELDPVILGLVFVYILFQTFLTGGVLAVFRGSQGSWNVRSLLHASGFYFGRLFRITLVALLMDYAVFRLNAPFARFVDHRALDADTETHAMVLVIGRYVLLLLLLLFVHMVSCYAKIIVVLEERSSAILAFVSSLSFCLGNLIRTAGHYLAVVGLGALLLLLWSALDSHWSASGYKSQAVSLLLAQGFVLGRIGLRLALLAGQLVIYRRLSTSP